MAKPRKDQEQEASSLELLKPEVPSAPPSSSEHKTPTEIYLEELGSAMCWCVSTQDWDHWAFGHITNDFEAYIEHSDKPFARTSEEYKEAYNAIARKYPGYRNELIDIDADVDEKAGLATLWILLRIHHHPTGTMKGNDTSENGAKGDDCVQCRLTRIPGRKRDHVLPQKREGKVAVL